MILLTKFTRLCPQEKTLPLHHHHQASAFPHAIGRAADAHFLAAFVRSLAFSIKGEAAMTHHRWLEDSTVSATLYSSHTSSLAQMLDMFQQGRNATAFSPAFLE